MKAAAVQLKTEAKKIGNNKQYLYDNLSSPLLSFFLEESYITLTHTGTPLALIYLMMYPLNSDWFPSPLLLPLARCGGVLDLGEVEDMQDDLADLFEDMTEINDIMGTWYYYDDPFSNS